MTTIEWDDFSRVELRVGTVVDVQAFPEARKPAWKLWVDFGDEIGVRKSSAQITDLYTAEELLGTQVVAVVNFCVEWNRRNRETDRKAARRTRHAPAGKGHDSGRACWPRR